MAKSRKKKYILCTLRSVSKFTRNVRITCSIAHSEPAFGWVYERYTRTGLFGHIYGIEKYKKESFKDNLSLDMSEIKPEFSLESNWWAPKYAIAYDGVNGMKLLDWSSIEKDYNEYSKEKRRHTQRVIAKIESNRRLNQYEFRHGAVPCTGHCHWHSGCYYRNVKLGQARIQNNGPKDEYSAFESAKYKIKTLPVWDDRCRHTDKSWKTSCKVRKQYMKHTRKRVSVGKDDYRYSWLNELDELAASM